MQDNTQPAGSAERGRLFGAVATDWADTWEAPAVVACSFVVIATSS